jgi:DNA invertase Pin-like site-specific DNA recombinase
MGLDAQWPTVNVYIASRNGKLLEEYREVESGEKDDRPQRAAALAACRKLRAVLVIAKARPAGAAGFLYLGLIDGDVDFVACDFPQANRLTLHILAAVAEHERTMISERTKAALQAAKARGVKLGNPALATAEEFGHRAQSEIAHQRAENVRPIIDQITRSGVKSLNGIAMALSARGVKTARGPQCRTVLATSAGDHQRGPVARHVQRARSRCILGRLAAEWRRGCAAAPARRRRSLRPACRAAHCGSHEQRPSRYPDYAGPARQAGRRTLQRHRL